MFKILMLMLSVTALTAQNNLDIENEPICFENPFMVLSNHGKIVQQLKRVKFYLPLKNIDNAPLEIYYTLANDHTDAINDLFCTFNEETQTYNCGIECDGGTLEFDAKKRIMRMESIRLNSCSDNIIPPNFLINTSIKKESKESIKPIKNPDKQGNISTVGFFNENERDLYQNDWVYESKCQNKKKPKVDRVFYTTEEYIKAFPNKEKRDFYFQYFNEPLKKDNDNETIVESIKIKKSYKNIQEFMKKEGFKSKLFKNQNILLFVHNNKRALSFVSSYVEDKYGGACSFNGHYLMKLKHNVLTYKYFSGGHGDISPVIMFEMEVLN